MLVPFKSIAEEEQELSTTQDMQRESHHALHSPEAQPRDASMDN